MAEIIVAELAATWRLSIRVFQTLLKGKIGQAGAPLRVGGGALGLFGSRGFVPAVTSSASARPSPSVSGWPGLVPRVLLLAVGQAVGVAVLAAVPDAIAIGVGQVWVRARQLFRAVGEAVAIGVLGVVLDAVAVGVLDLRVRACLVFGDVPESVVVRILMAVGDAVAIGVAAGRVGPRVQLLIAVREPVAIGVGGGCRRRPDQDARGHEDPDHDGRDHAV